MKFVSGRSLQKNPPHAVIENDEGFTALMHDGSFALIEVSPDDRADFLALLDEIGIPKTPRKA